MAGSITNRKQDFKDPAQMAAEQEQAQALAQKQKPKDKDQENIDAVNSAITGDADKNDAELKAMEAYTAEDMKLAEEMLFRGYAERDYKVLPNATITVVSMSSAEVELVNEIVYEFANKPGKKEDQGLSAKVVEGQQQMLLIALGFKGINGADISPAAGRHLSFIKAGFKRMGDAEVDGDIKKFNEVRAELKKVIWTRAAELKRVPVSFIDVIAKKRYEFERLMYDITSREDLIPKY
jgi:hypothetical protein